MDLKKAMGMGRFRVGDLVVIKDEGEGEGEVHSINDDGTHNVIMRDDYKFFDVEPSDMQPV